MSLPTEANVSRPEAHGYDALLDYGANDADSLYLRLAVGPGRAMTFQTVEPQEKAPNVAQSPEDMRAESGETFSQSDFSGGADLRRAHRRDGTSRDASRYYDSRGIDISLSESGEISGLRLLRAGSTVLRAGGQINDAGLVRLDTASTRVLYAVLSASNRVDRTANPTAATPTWTVEDPLDGETDSAVSSIAGLNGLLYAAFSLTSNGVHQRSSGGTWDHWSDQTTLVLRAVKGRLIGIDQEFLYELRAGAASVLLATAGDQWNAVIDAGSVILAAADDGLIYSFAEQEGEVVLVGQTELGGGELPRAMAAAHGVDLIATQEGQETGGAGRLYRAAVVGQRLRDIQLIKRWESLAGVARYPGTMLTTRDAVWIPVPETADETHVWKYHLATGGLSRDLVIEDDTTWPSFGGHVEGMAEFDGRLFLRVDSEGLYRALTTYVDDGYLISPLADFYNAASKAWIGARLQTGDLPADTQVTLYYSTDPAAIDDPSHASWTLIITADDSAPGISVEAPILGVESRWAALMVVLTANPANTATPEVLAFSIRGVRLPTEQDYVLPVNVSDRLEMPFRQAQTVPGMGDRVYEALQDLVGRVVTATLLRPDEQVKGQIVSVSTPIQGIPVRGSPTVYCQVVIRGQRQ